MLLGQAAAWAEKCANNHSTYGNGENIAWGYDNGYEAVDAWCGYCCCGGHCRHPSHHLLLFCRYAEVKDYTSGGSSYAHPDIKYEVWGHFSQVVWAATTKVGCALLHAPRRP